MSEPEVGDGTPDERPLGERLAALMERLSEEYTRGEGVKVAAGAREDFLQATGRVHEGDHCFDDRMAQFMEWFLLDRPLAPEGPTPAERYLEQRAAELTPEERQDLLALCTSHRSLYRLAGPDAAGRLVLDDLLEGMQWSVTAPGGLPGVVVGDVFEARLVGRGGEVHFTVAFCYHPSEAAPGIRRHVERRLGRLGPAFLDELMSLRLAYDRAEGAPVHSIYRFGR